MHSEDIAPPVHLPHLGVQGHFLLWRQLVRSPFVGTSTLPSGLLMGQDPAVMTFRNANDDSSDS